MNKRESWQRDIYKLSNVKRKHFEEEEALKEIGNIYPDQMKLTLQNIIIASDYINYQQRCIGFKIAAKRNKGVSNPSTRE